MSYKRRYQHESLRNFLLFFVMQCLVIVPAVGLVSLWVAIGIASQLIKNRIGTKNQQTIQ